MIDPGLQSDKSSRSCFADGKNMVSVACQELNA